VEVFFSVAASPDTPQEVRRQVFEKYSEELAKLGVSLAERSDIAVIVVATGGSENEVLTSARSFNVLLAWPEYNSLSAALEAASALREIGKFAKVVRLSRYGEPPRESLIRALRLLNLMKAGVPRFGVVGTPNPWLVASNIFLATVERVELEESLRALDVGAGAEDAKWLLARASSSEYSEEQLRPMAAYARALESLAKAKKWDGLTLGCWCFDKEAIRRMGWTPCISLALLNELGVPASCEGDLRALYSMYILTKLSGRAGWMGNVNIAEGDLILLTHDGIPPIMAERYSITKRMTGAPAAIKAEVSSGRPATLLRVSADLKKALLLRAVTIELERIDACATQIGFKLLRGSADDVMRAALGNHLAFVLDDVYEEAREYLEYMGAEVIPR
jgi:L-fucose isomerase-like protein